MKIKRVKEIVYGDQTSIELDINGKWQIGRPYPYLLTVLRQKVEENR